MGLSFQKVRVRTVMFLDNGKSEGTVRVPARGMTSSSVRKRQQPPSLECHENMLRR